MKSTMPTALRNGMRKMQGMSCRHSADMAMIFSEIWMFFALHTMIRNQIAAMKANTTEAPFSAFISASECAWGTVLCHWVAVV